MKNVYIVDTREQKPFDLQPQKRQCLIVGDYTTTKLLGRFHIERKSLVDLYGSITKGHLRFKKEIIRAKHHSIHLIVLVEGSRKNFGLKKFYGGSQRKMSGETLLKIIDSITLNHGTQFHWHASRNACQKNLIKFLGKIPKGK